ncbi:hypothetical protein [Glycocaulis sp.]
MKSAVPIVIVLMAVAACSEPAGPGVDEAASPVPACEMVLVDFDGSNAFEIDGQPVAIDDASGIARALAAISGERLCLSFGEGFRDRTELFDVVLDAAADVDSKTIAVTFSTAPEDR